MESDEYELPSDPSDATATVTTSHVCKVCENNDAIMYLGVHCCAPCKMFFRRNADFDLNTHRCSFDGNCDVSVNSRGSCRYCRFQKCLSVGLQRELIRGPHTRQDHDRKKNKQKSTINVSNEKTPSLPAIVPTLDLLNNDRSLLTDDQWSLLSNVTHAYDDKCPTSTIRNTMALQLAYPSKMQLKMATDYFKQITCALYLSAGPFIKTLPAFMNMSIGDQGILVERNIRSMSGFGGILVLREADLCQNPYYHNASVAAYGRQRTSEAMRIVNKADLDGTLIKLMIPILAFSTCSDILEPSSEHLTSSNTTPGGTRLFSNTLHLLKVQNTYAEMMFKYMLYRYGYKEAASRFAKLIKSCIDQNVMVSGDGDLRKHDEMVQSITEQTERSLTLHDEVIE